MYLVKLAGRVIPEAKHALRSRAEDAIVFFTRKSDVLISSRYLEALSKRMEPTESVRSRTETIHNAGVTRRVVVIVKITAG